MPRNITLLMICFFFTVVCFAVVLRAVAWAGRWATMQAGKQLRTRVGWHIACRAVWLRGCGYGGGGGG